MNRQNYRDVELAVLRWAEERKIVPRSTSTAQAHKTNEEAAELMEAAAELRTLRRLINMDPSLKDNVAVQVLLESSRKDYRDAVGDIVVTLINGCALEDLDVVDCLAAAHDEIKDRKGELMPNGIFVKENT